MASRATAMLAIPAFVGLSLVSGQMIPLVFGAKWQSSVPLAEVLSFIGIVHSITQFNGQVCKAVGRAGTVLRFSALNTVVNVMGFFVAVHFGIYWVAVAYVARGIMLYPLSVTMVRTSIHHDVRTHLTGFIAPTLATLVMAGCVGGFEQVSHTWPSWPRLITTVLIGAVVYLSTIWLLARSQIRTLVASLRDARHDAPRRRRGARLQRPAEEAAPSGPGELDRGAAFAEFAAADSDLGGADLALPSPVPNTPSRQENVRMAEAAQVLSTPYGGRHRRAGFRGRRLEETSPGEPPTDPSLT